MNTKQAPSVMSHRLGFERMTMHYTDLTDEHRSLWPHWHTFFELEFILSGNGTQIINGNSYEMRRGEIHVLRPMDIHKFNWTDPTRLYLIQFHNNHISDKLLNRLLAITDDPIAYLDDDDCKLCESLCASLDKLKDRDEPSALDRIKRMTDLILSIFLSTAESSQKQLAHPQQELTLMSSIIKYIRENYRQPITADSLAKHFGFNTVYFRRLFHENFDFSISDYLKLLRLNYAKNMLISSEAKIFNIMIDSGYSSNATFSRDFREKYGCTPSELRNEYYDL